MLRPWLPLISLVVGLALIWLWVPQALAWAGGLLLGLALLAPFLRRSKPKADPWDRAKALDWKLIDNSLARDRPAQDCERPETLGICTGRECLVYDSCNFNIKRVGL